MEDKNKLEHFSKFKRQPAWQQADTLEKEGTALARRYHQGWVIQLYALENYYIELWEKQDVKITTTFRKSAKSLAVLEPYMDAIEVIDLMGS